jgi:hypothetical protein
MASYQEVLNLIRSALSQRPSGSRVQVEDHEQAEIALLDYIELVKSQSGGSSIREAHAQAVADVQCYLTWSEPFPDVNYCFVVNGFDNRGNPVEIMLISRSSTRLAVKTLVNASLTAIARPYATNQSSKMP